MPRTAEVYAFGPYVLDVTERRLRRGDQIVALPPKAHDVLVVLLRRAGTLVTKRELLDLVWNDVAVEEGVLSVYVSALRKSLADDPGRPVYIDTVPRSGYRFSAPVTRPLAGAEQISMKWPVGVLPARPELSELIGRGRACLMSASRSALPGAIDAFRSAVVLDPEYAPAHAGLAVAHCAEAELRLTSPDHAYAAARESALRALAMDANNADAQVALGTVLFLSDWNWEGARRCLRRALELDPDHTEGCLLYGRLLEGLGLLEEGLAAKQKALERNPASPTVVLQIALSYWNQRRYDDVIAWAERSLALDPGHLLAREYLAAAYLMKGDLERHMAESLAHAASAGAPAEVIHELRHIFDARGRAGVVQYALAANANGPALQLALLHAEAGNLDEAFRQLDIAIERRDPALVHLAVAPQWDRLRADPRFQRRLDAVICGRSR